MDEPVPPSGLADPRRVIAVYLILVVALSSIFWYIIAARPQFAIATGLLQNSIFLLMWCPAVAAILTRLALQRNLRGFGFRIGEQRWWALAIVIPIVLGLVMFGTAWVTGIAPFLPDRAAAMLALPALGAILLAIGFNLVSAAGEEIGWRGLLVPELGRITTFTWVAIISAVVWFCWHVPVMLVGGYGGSGGIAASLAIFFVAMIGGSTFMAWMRLRSGSVWPAVIIHGLDNYFVQTFFPSLTATTPAGEAMLGEFGWYIVLISIVLALVFWALRHRLPTLPRPEGGL